MASEPACVLEVGVRMSRTLSPEIVRAMIGSHPRNGSISRIAMTTQSLFSADLCQAWPRPSAPKPIVVIGAGSIVRDAHLPIYKRLGFPVSGIFDVNPDASRDKARAFAIARVFGSIDEAAGIAGAIFDVAIPPENIAGVLERLPARAARLIQNPPGRHLAEDLLPLPIFRNPPFLPAMNLHRRYP